MGRSKALTDYSLMNTAHVPSKRIAPFGLTALSRLWFISSISVALLACDSADSLGSGAHANKPNPAENLPSTNDGDDTEAMGGSGGLSNTTGSTNNGGQGGSDPNSPDYHSTNTPKDPGFYPTAGLDDISNSKLDDPGQNGTGGTNSGGPQESSTYLRIANFASDQQGIAICWRHVSAPNYQLLTTTNWPVVLAAPQVTAYVALPVGTYDFRVTTEEGDCNNVLAEKTFLTLGANAFTTFAVGVAPKDSTVSRLSVLNEHSSPSTSAPRLRLVNVNYANMVSLDLTTYMGWTDEAPSPTGFRRLIQGAGHKGAIAKPIDDNAYNIDDMGYINWVTSNLPGGTGFELRDSDRVGNRLTVRSDETMGLSAGQDATMFVYSESDGTIKVLMSQDGASAKFSQTTREMNIIKDDEQSPHAIEGVLPAPNGSQSVFVAQGQCRKAVRDLCAKPVTGEWRSDESQKIAQNVKENEISAEAQRIPADYYSFKWVSPGEHCATGVEAILPEIVESGANLTRVSYCEKDIEKENVLGNDTTKPNGLARIRFVHLLEGLDAAELHTHVGVEMKLISSAPFGGGPTLLANSETSQWGIVDVVAGDHLFSTNDESNAIETESSVSLKAGRRYSLYLVGNLNSNDSVDNPLYVLCSDDETNDAAQNDCQTLPTHAEAILATLRVFLTQRFGNGRFDVTKHITVVARDFTNQRRANEPVVRPCWQKDCLDRWADIGICVCRLEL